MNTTDTEKRRDLRANLIADLEREAQLYSDRWIFVVAYLSNEEGLIPIWIRRDQNGPPTTFFCYGVDYPRTFSVVNAVIDSRRRT